MIFVTSIIKYKWTYEEAHLFLKSFRRIYKKNILYVFYDGSDFRTKILLKKFNCIIIKNIKKSSDYYSIKPLLLKQISLDHKKDLICWVDIDSIFLNKIPHEKFFLYPKKISKYMEENNSTIQKLSKLLKLKIQFHTTSAIFVFNFRLINLYYNKYMKLKQEYENISYVRKKIIENIMNDESIRNHIEELSFCEVVNNNSIKKSNQTYPEPCLGYYQGCNKKISIYCHDHYKINNIDVYYIPKILRSEDYMNYRLKENTGE